MKYLVLLCDGMADYPVEALGGKTPLEAANKPNMDKLAKTAKIGLCKTVADNLKPGSDVANLSVLGYNPEKYYTGRSPLEAGSIGIDMFDTDVSLRCNLVTLSTGECFEDKTLVDYCAGDISSYEARELVEFLQKELGNEIFRFYNGVSYRHCLIWKNGTLDVGELTPPHDITGRCVKDYVPSHENAQCLYELMKKAHELLQNHPVNLERIRKNLRPANGIWLWGEGKRAELDSFEEKYGVKASMISAVDLLKGIGKFAEMNVVFVDNATGYIDTNFEGKAQAALDEFANGQDFVYVHIEAPDECGHRNEVQNKVRSIEIIDEKVLGPILDELEKYKNYKILIMPDHPTPLSLMTHTNDAVPFLMYTRRETFDGAETFNEKTAKASGIYFEKGYTIMDDFLKEAVENKKNLEAIEDID
ncbi:MAG: cofactor-independent phosphoglycerate mutase [Oscillospiraceae bacterium]|nr:cofactor-independent phosphoglycerate mutase [Oscillospiraceae bacterium]